MRYTAKRGFTLVELLVVIAIIGVMMAMTVPAIQASREMARRNTCQSNLAQLMLAMQSYETAFESFSAGVTNPTGPIRSEAIGQHQGWLIHLLPYVDEGNAYRLIDFSKSVYDPANAPVRELTIGLFRCPSDPGDERAVSSYAGCHHDVEAPIDVDNRGVLYLNSHIRREDVSDGLSHTLFVGEKRQELGDLGWMSGTRATLRNTGLRINDESGAGTQAPSPTYVGGFGSSHSGGAMTGFGDASVTFISDTIDVQIWQQLGQRADGKLLNFSTAD